MSKDLLVDPKEFWSNIVSFSDYNLDQVSKYFNQKHRSSTIFPVYKKINSRCYISCLTYWIKKHDSKVAIKLTARNIQGYPVESLWKPIDNYFAFNFDVNQFNYFKAI